MKTVDYQVRDDIGEVRLIRPDVLNAMNLPMLGEMIAALGSAASDDRVRAVVVSGEGRAFCSGWDRSAVSDEPADVLEIDRQGAALMRAFEQVRKPMVAALQGPVVGGGVLVAAACDLRVASASAWFWLPEVTFGSPVMWTGLGPLVREIGLSSTRWLALTGNRTDCEWAHQRGLVHEVAATSVRDRAVELAQQVASFPGRGAEQIKDDLAGIASVQIPEQHCHSAADVWEALSSPKFRG